VTTPHDIAGKRAATVDSLWLLGAIAPLLVVWGAAFVVVPRFALLFTNFAADVPLATWILIRYYPYVPVLGLLVFAVRQLWPHAEGRGMAALVAGLLISAVLCAAGMYALYAPIFQLGASAG
jgi:hypothetical protein